MCGYAVMALLAVGFPTSFACAKSASAMHMSFETPRAPIAYFSTWWQRCVLGCAPFYISKTQLDLYPRWMYW